jgi:HAD superfamily, subfamily IIIB (Acid phosphatase)
MRRHLQSRGRALRYALVFAAGLAVGAIGLAAASALQRTSVTNGTPVVSVRPTGVGLPLVGASGTVGAGDYTSALKSYHDSGAYDTDLKTVDRRAGIYLVNRARALQDQAARQCHAKRAARRACPKPKLALVLDIDETSLSNYANLAAANFSNVVGALAIGVINGNDPAIQPTLQLFRQARSHGVAVFFITGRPGNIPGVRSQTVANLKSVGYANWSGLSLNPGGLATVPYKSGQRTKIEQQGYRIIANVGDQESDLQGGHADRAFKLPNPFYFIGP